MQYESLKSTVLKRLEKELPPKLYYHSVRHTRDVLAVCAASAERENLSPTDKILLLTAALLHDAGFLHTTKDHEAEGVAIAESLSVSYTHLTLPTTPYV